MLGRKQDNREVSGTRVAGWRQSLGRCGEEAAVAYLEARNYAILERNFRCRLGEIDIVARQGRAVVFVEVRTRRGDSCGSPEESVDERKRARLRRAAAFYLRRNGLCDMECRFDVVSVTADARGSIKRIELLRDAFW